MISYDDNIIYYVNAVHDYLMYLIVVIKGVKGKLVFKCRYHNDDNDIHVHIKKSTTVKKKSKGNSTVLVKIVLRVSRRKRAYQERMNTYVRKAKSTEINSTAIVFAQYLNTCFNFIGQAFFKKNYKN